MEPAVGRLAPSPTGLLHVGHARTFFVAWLAARSVGGRIQLRMEDIDVGRVRPGASEAVLADLNWLGLDIDGEPLFQSRRIALYLAALERLKQREAVYPCTCTRAEIERAASAPHEGEEGPTYPGTCALRSVADGNRLSSEGRSFAWRFRANSASRVWEDLFLGRVQRPVGGDFIVARWPFVPSYQLAVVYDDATTGVNQVIRGDDLVPSTPRQLELYEALGLTPPAFGHIPLVVNHEGQRLAKRDGSIKLASLRERGISHDWVMGYLAYSCGWSTQIEPGNPHDWLQRFRWDTIPRAPWKLDDAFLHPG